MSEFLFGTCMRKLSASECARRNEACIAEGGYGYVQMKDGHQWKGWFRGPYRGDPFDGDLKKRVIARLGCRWTRLPDIANPLEMYRVQFKLGCDEQIVCGVHAIHPDNCPHCHGRVTIEEST